MPTRPRMLTARMEEKMSLKKLSTMALLAMMVQAKKTKGRQRVMSILMMRLKTLTVRTTSEKVLLMKVPNMTQAKRMKGQQRVSQGRAGEHWNMSRMSTRMPRTIKAILYTVACGPQGLSQ